jgi:hypothetical protein
MENWYERVAENLEDILIENSDLLEELISEGVIDIEIKPYAKNPEIIIHYFDDDDPPLIISYNVKEAYFYRDLRPELEELPPVRFMMETVEQLVNYIHTITVKVLKENGMYDDDEEDEYEYDDFDDNEEDEFLDDEENEIYLGHFSGKEEFMEHIEHMALKKESEDEYLKNVQWITNMESSAKIEVPKKGEIKTVIQVGKIEEKNEFVIKKARYSGTEEAGEAELSYLKLNKEEARAIKAELDKYTAS